MQENADLANHSSFTPWKIMNHNNAILNLPCWVLRHSRNSSELVISLIISAIVVSANAHTICHKTQLPKKHSNYQYITEHNNY